mgnify:CR=1 FL=1
MLKNNVLGASGFETAKGKKRKEVEALLRDSMQKAKEMGWTVAQAVTQDQKTHRVCAIGAWGIANGVFCDDFVTLSRRIGLDSDKTTAFVRGFDFVDCGYCECNWCGSAESQFAKTREKDGHPKWFDLGRKLAEEFVGAPKDEATVEIQPFTVGGTE